MWAPEFAAKNRGSRNSARLDFRGVGVGVGGGEVARYILTSWYGHHADIGENLLDWLRLYFECAVDFVLFSLLGGGPDRVYIQVYIHSLTK